MNTIKHVNRVRYFGYCRQMPKNVELKIKKRFYELLVAVFGISAPNYPLDDTLSKFYMILTFLCKKFTLIDLTSYVTNDSHAKRSDLCKKVQLCAKGSADPFTRVLCKRVRTFLHRAIRACNKVQDPILARLSARHLRN